MSNTVRTHSPFPRGQLSFSLLQVCMTKTCEICKQDFEVNGGNALRCSKCNKEYKKRYKRNWDRANRPSRAGMGTKEEK